MKKILTSKRFIVSIFILVAILLLAAFFRFIHLNSLPVFVDEAIYVRWSQVMKAEATLRFLPLSDGKQPLFMWLTIPFLKLFSDPLIAGRALSAFSGIGTIIGIFVLSLILFRTKKVGLLASAMYAISPYAVFFERLALVDSLLAMLGVWTLIFSLIMVKTRRLDAAMLTGFTLGAALITKSPALFFIMLLPVSFLFFQKSKSKDKLEKKFSFIYTAFLLIISWGIGLFVFSLLRLGPGFHLIFSRNLDYVYPFTRVFTNPTDPFISNFREYLSWVTFFGPYPVYFLLTIALLNIKKYFKQYLLLAAWALGSVIIQSEYSIAFTARYVLFTIPFLFIIAASSILTADKRLKKFLLVFLIWFAGLAMYRNYILISKPAEAKMPIGERSGYLEDWTAGHGIKQAAEMIIDIRDANPNDKILVATEGFFGTLPDGLQIYLEKQENITVIGVGNGIRQAPEQLVEHKKAGGRSFLVANSSRLTFSEDDFADLGLEVLYQIKKPDRTPNTHSYVNSGPFDTFYLFELVDISSPSDIVLP